MPRDQAKAPTTQPFDRAAFDPSGQTTLRWLGMAGFLINSRGINVMVDPLLEGFDMPIMTDMPIAPGRVPHLDAILVTHSDNDHYSVPTCRALAAVTHAYHSTEYVASLMRDEGLPAHGHGIGDTIDIGPMQVTLTPRTTLGRTPLRARVPVSPNPKTPVDHAWSKALKGTRPRRGADRDAGIPRLVDESVIALVVAALGSAERPIVRGDRPGG